MCLGEVPSDLAVIPAEGRIVQGMELGMLMMDFQGRQEPVESVLASFAQKHGLTVKQPTDTPPSRLGNALVTVGWLVGGTLLLGILGLVVWRRR